MQSVSTALDTSASTAILSSLQKFQSTHYGSQRRISQHPYVAQSHSSEAEIDIRVAGEKTGPVTGPPPPASDESKNAILSASQEDSTGQSAPGQDGGDKDAGKKVKSEKECTDISAFV